MKLWEPTSSVGRSGYNGPASVATPAVIPSSPVDECETNPEKVWRHSFCLPVQRRPGAPEQGRLAARALKTVHTAARHPALSS